MKKRLSSPLQNSFLLFLLSCHLLWGATTATWNVDVAGGTWSTATNWSPNAVPSAVDDTAIFANIITADRTVSLDANETVGTLQFNDNNNYTISPAVAQVLTFDVSSGGALIQVLNTNGNGSHTISAAITLSDSLTVSQGSTGTFTLSGIIGESAARSLTLSGAGTLSLTGVNTFSGGTVISGGVLTIPANTALGAAAAGVTMGTGTLQVSASFTIPRAVILTGVGTMDPQAANTLTLSGVISGTGSLSKISAGTVVLSGANTYTGGTSITAGTLSISSDGNLGASTGSMTLGAGTLVTTAAITSSRAISLTGAGTIDTEGNTDTFSGAVTGTGSLTKVGAGTLILTGSNSYSGGTTISVGTLQGNSASLPGNITDGGALIFNQTTTGTYSGVLSGAGTLTKSGAGQLTLSGNSAGFTGATSLSAGSLCVNGSLAGTSLLTVAAGATLGGTGTVGPVSNSGVISPGCGGIGTLTVSGALTYVAGSSTLIDIAPLSSDRIVVTGAAALGGPVTVSPLAGFYGLSATYTLLTGVPIVGTYASLSMTNPNFLGTLVYSATDVRLLVQIVAPFADFPFTNSNTQSVGNNFDALNFRGTLTPDADLLSVINSFVGQSFAVINGALDQMHPAQFSAFVDLQAEVGGQLLSLFHHKPILTCGCWGRWRVWAEPFGNWNTVRGEGMQIGYRATTVGVALGVDTEVVDNWIIGVGGAWNGTDLKWDFDNRGYGQVNGGYGALYTDYSVDNVYLGASLYAGVDFYETVRHLLFTTFDRQAVGSYSALDFAAQFSGAYFFGTPACHLYPYANVDYLYLHTGGFTEKDALSLSLRVRKNRNSTLRVEGGMGLEFIDKNYEETICVAPLVALGYTLNYPLHRGKYSANFVNQPISFSTTGWDLARQLLTVRFGLRIYYRCVSLSGEYIGDCSTEGGSPFINQRANFALEINW